MDQWQTKLPPAMEPHRAMLANYKDFPSLAKALADNMTAARAKPAGLIIPPADAPPEEQAKYQAELKRLYGVPDSAEGYKLEKPATIPAGLEWNDEMANGFKAKAAELGLTPAQAQALVQYDFERLSGMQAKQSAEMDQLAQSERAEMARRWGDQVDATLNLATRAALHPRINLPNAQALFDPKSPEWAGPDIADAFATFGRMIGEQQLPTSAAVNNMDPETLAKDIIGNPSNPEYEAFHKSDHPNSRSVREKVDQLFRRATNGQ